MFSSGCAQVGRFGQSNACKHTFVVDQLSCERHVSAVFFEIIVKCKIVPPEEESSGLITLCAHSLISIFPL